MKSIETGIGGVVFYLVGIPGLFMIVLGTFLTIAERGEPSSDRSDRPSKLLKTGLALFLGGGAFALVMGLAIAATRN
jgi:hypothetical protein